MRKTFYLSYEYTRVHAIDNQLYTQFVFTNVLSAITLHLAREQKHKFQPGDFNDREENETFSSLFL